MWAIKMDHKENVLVPPVGPAVPVRVGRPLAASLGPSVPAPQQIGWLVLVIACQLDSVPAAAEAGGDAAAARPVAAVQAVVAAALLLCPAPHPPRRLRHLHLLSHRHAQNNGSTLSLVPHR